MPPIAFLWVGNSNQFTFSGGEVKGLGSCKKTYLDAKKVCAGSPVCGGHHGLANSNHPGTNPSLVLNQFSHKCAWWTGGDVFKGGDNLWILAWYWVASNAFMGSTKGNIERSRQGHEAQLLCAEAVDSLRRYDCPTLKDDWEFSELTLWRTIGKNSHLERKEKPLSAKLLYYVI